MTFREQIRTDFDQTTRRQAKAIHCRIMKDEKALALIRKYPDMLLPQTIEINIHPNTGFDPITGHLFAIPVYAWKAFEKLIQNYDSSNGGEEQTSSESTTTEPTRDVEVNQDRQEKVWRVDLPLVEFLRDNIILARVTPAEYANEMKPDGAVVDVVVDGPDVLQSVNAKLIPRYFK